MNKKIGLLLFSLCVPITSHAELTCTTSGNGDTVTMKITNPNEYYNGEIEISGQEITDYFSSELNSVNADCQIKSSQPVCVFTARVDLDKIFFFNGGRFAPGFIGFADSFGFKILPTSNGQSNGKNWFFIYCESRE